MTRSSSVATWLAWIAANAAGELLGLGFVFLAGFALFHHFGEPRSVVSILLFGVAAVSLGAIEGAVVGYAQWLVLQGMAPRILRARWILATIVGAVVAWLLGMIPSTVASLQSSSSEQPVQEPSLVVVLLFAAGIGLVGGLVLSFAQWLVLKQQGSGSIWWLPANAAAWAIGMPWIFWLIGATVAEHQDIHALLLFLGGLGVAGGLVGAVHGAILIRFIAPTWHVA